VAALEQRVKTLEGALEDCRTNFSGYIIHETKDYEQVIAEFWKEIQRIDKAARAALRLAKGE
jgi:hypothetical protein